MCKAPWQLCITLLIPILLFIGCGQETPEQAVTKALKAVQNLDQKTMLKYFQDGDPTRSVPENEVIEDDDEFLKLIFKNFNFKVISSSESGDTATVKTGITNTDFGVVFGEYVAQALAMVFTQDDLSEDAMDKLLIDLLSRNNNATLTSTVDISLEKDGNGWVILMDDDLQDALFGGMISVIASLNEDDDIKAEQDLKSAITAEKGQTIVIDGFCELTINDAIFAKKIIPPKPVSYYTYYEVKEEGTTYLDIVITFKSLLTTGKRADEFASVKILYDDKYEYRAFSTIEEPDGADFTYTSITSIEPLRLGTIHYLATVPIEVEEGTKPVAAVITIEDQDILYTIR